ncbi:MAG: hypothetical protein WCE45_01085 [Sedimentisphaerales bacterium]
MESYDVCKIAEPGEGEHCDCDNTTVLKIVGYIYPCRTLWNEAKIALCILQELRCEVTCYTQGPAACFNCIAGFGTGCCADGCEICDFIVGCVKDGSDPYQVTPVYKTVFSGFGC